MSLRWEKQGRGLWGYSGQLRVGAVGQRTESGRWWWRITAVQAKWNLRGDGDHKTRASARRAAERAWRGWLELADLTPARRGPPSATTVANLTPTDRDGNWGLGG